MTTLRNLLARGVVFAERKLEVKERLIGGTYETAWTDITSYVSSWGTITESYGDIVFLSEYIIDASAVVLDNSSRKFNSEKDPNSIFYHKSRMGSKFKFTMTYSDDDHSDVSVTTFFSYIYKNPVNSNNNLIAITHAPLIKVLQLFPATGIATTSDTTVNIVSKLVKKTKNSIRIFDKYFEGANDAAKYILNPDSKSVTTISTPTIDEGDSVWDKINDYAMYDDFFAYTNDDGAFVFDSKDETASVQFTLNGAGASTEEDGVNIISLSERDSTINFWPRIVIEYGTDELKVSSSTDWTPGDGSDSDIYGERTYEANRPFKELTEGEAQTIADAKRDAYGLSIKKEYNVNTVIPQLKLNDLIKLNYFGEQTVESGFTIAISAIAGPDPIGDVAGSFEIDNESFKVIQKAANWNNFSYNYAVRAI